MYRVLYSCLSAYARFPNKKAETSDETNVNLFDYFES